MAALRPFRRWSHSFVIVGSLALALAGCQKGPKLLQVNGKVFVGDAPLAGGVVTYIPDSAKGNTLKVNPTSMVNSDGSYSLLTDGKAGAPAGWYKVTISTQFPGMGMGGKPAEVTTGAPASLQSSTQVDPKYTDAGQTPETKEVKAGAPAGYYDIKITK
jgi:hypothetical protein